MDGAPSLSGPRSETRSGARQWQQDALRPSQSRRSSQVLNSLPSLLTRRSRRTKRRSKSVQHLVWARHSATPTSKFFFGFLPQYLLNLCFLIYPGRLLLVTSAEFLSRVVFRYQSFLISLFITNLTGSKLGKNHKKDFNTRKTSE